MRKAKREPMVPMISIWKTDNPGVSSSNQITLPLVYGRTYNFTVDWGDGTSSTITSYNDPAITHTYGTAGTKTVTMTGHFPSFRFQNAGDRQKILDITQWGSNPWQDMHNSFWGCINLQVTATDAPNFKNTTGVVSMFEGATAFNSPVNHWDMSTIINTTSMFKNASSFNQPVSSWDTSNVTRMYAMFQGATVFNQPLATWNVGNVTDMGWMFMNADAFNQPLAAWNMSKMKLMNRMFYYARAFNQSLAGWDTSQVTDMSNMFQGAIAFNGALTGWDTDLPSTNPLIPGTYPM